MAKLISEQDYIEVAKKHNYDVALVKALNHIESRGSGFLPTGHPKILFEKHIFYKKLCEYGYVTWANRFTKMAPNLCYPRWTAGGYGRVSDQPKRLEDAILLCLKIDPNMKIKPDDDEDDDSTVDKVYKDFRECGLLSCSWGVGQVMGFNFKQAGFSDLQSFVNAMYNSERDQLDAMITFIKNSGAHSAMLRKDFNTIARIYNGKGYAKNGYHTKLRSFYNQFNA